MARLQEEWIEDGTNINDALELLRTLKANRSCRPSELEDVRRLGAGRDL